MDRTFYIAEPDPVIRLDISGALGVEYPSSSIFVGEKLQELETYGSMSDLCLFVSSKLVDAAAAAVLNACFVNGAQIVFIGDKIETVYGARYLEFPFTNKMISEALADRDASQAV